MKIFKNRKGNWGDGIVIAIAVIVLSVVIPSLFYFNYSLNQQLSNIETFNNNTVTKELLEERQERLPYIFDMILPLILLGLIIATTWSARKIFSSHQFTPIILFFGPILTLLGLVVEIYWDKFINTENVLTTLIQTELLLTNAIMNRFVFVMVFLVLLIGIALYSKDD